MKEDGHGLLSTPPCTIAREQEHFLSTSQTVEEALDAMIRRETSEKP